MIDKTKIIDTVIKRLKNLPINNYLDIRTYKRNRSVIIVKKKDDELLLIQNGYDRQTYSIKSSQLKKLLKTLLKKEFPRSNKVRLYTMGEYNEQDATEIRRKII